MILQHPQETQKVLPEGRFCYQLYILGFVAHTARMGGLSVGKPELIVTVYTPIGWEGRCPGDIDFWDKISDLTYRGQ